MIRNKKRIYLITSIIVLGLLISIFTASAQNSKVKPIKQLGNGYYRLNKLVISGDGRYAVGGDKDGKLMVFDMTTGNLVRELKDTKTVRLDDVFSIAVSSDGRYIVSSLEQGIIYCWDNESGSLIYKKEFCRECRTSISITPDDKKLVLAGYGIWVWDLKSGKQLYQLAGKEHYYQRLALSLDGKYAASGDNNAKKIKIWNLRNRRLYKVLEGHKWKNTDGKEYDDYISALAFTHDSRYLISAPWYDTTIKIWNIHSGKVAKSFNHRSKGYNGVPSMSISPDGKYLLTGNYGSIKIWDLKTYNPIEDIAGYPPAVITPNGNSIVYYRKILRVIPFPEPAASRPAYGKVVKEFSKQCRIAVLSPDNKNIITTMIGPRLNELFKIDLETGSEHLIGAKHKEIISALEISPDTKYIASGSRDKDNKETLKLWDFNTGKLVKVLKGHSEPVVSIAFSPDSRYLASGSHDGTVRVWDLETGKTMERLKKHKYNVNGVVFTPDGKYIVSGSSAYRRGNPNLILWDYKKDDIIWSKTTRYNIMALDVDPAGKYVVTMDQAGFIKKWELADGKENISYIVPEYRRGRNRRGIQSLFISKDGKYLVAAGNNNWILVFDFTSGKLLNTNNDYSGTYLFSVSMSQDSKYLLAAGDTMKVYGMYTEEGDKGRKIVLFRGMVYRAAGKNITVISPGSRVARPGHIMIFLNSQGRETGRGKVTRIFHTNVQVRMIKGYARKGNVSVIYRR